MKAVCGGRAGVADGSPYVREAARSADRRPARQPPGSAVGVARTAAVADRPGPLLPGRAVRAEHLDHGHGAVPELLVEPAYDGRARAASAGWPRPSSRCARRAGRRRTTRGCSARRPRRRPAPAQRAKTPCTRRSRSQPWSATSRPTVASSGCGSRSSGCAPETRPRAVRLRRVAGCFRGPLAPGRPAPTPGSGRGPGRGRRRGARARLAGRARRASVVGTRRSAIAASPRRRRRRTGPRRAPAARRRRPPR